MWFRTATEGLRHLFPVSKAVAAYTGGSQPGREVCANIPLSTEEVLIKVPSPGFYVCVLTNQGRYSELKVFADDNPELISISYTTWDTVAATPTPTPTIPIATPTPAPVPSNGY